MIKKSLIVDDVEVSRYVLSTHMEQLGYAVTAVEDGDQALEEIRKDHFDVILLDWHLRRESSLTFIPKIRKVKGAEKTPILICSGVEQGNVAKEIKEADAQGFVPKPSHIERLSEELRKIGLS